MLPPRDFSTGRQKIGGIKTFNNRDEAGVVQPPRWKLKARVAAPWTECCLHHAALTEKFQRCRVGYEFEMIMSGINF